MLGVWGYDDPDAADGASAAEIGPCEGALEAEDVLWGTQDGQNTDGGATEEEQGSGKPCVASEAAREKSGP